MGALPHDARLLPASRVEHSHGRTLELVAWFAGYAVAIYVFSLPQLSPTIPGTELRLVSVPLALFQAALILRPPREAPWYSLIYAGVSLWFEIGSPHLDFAVARVALETAQTLLLVWLMYRLFFHHFGDPIIVGVWGVVVVAFTAVGASLILFAASLIPMSRADYVQELGGNPWLAWRHWWLCNACSYLALGGTVATLVNLRHRLKLLLTTPGFDRRRFIGTAVALLIVSLVAFPINDMSWVGLPPDVKDAMRLLPLPFAMAMAARARANGAAIAILIFTTVAVISVTGPNASANWAGPVSSVSPTQTLLLVTTITCMVLAGISRQLKRALNGALEASEMKSRFIAMLNHELRTPLNAILGFSELMRLQNVRALDEAIGPIDNIHASGQRLLAMIEGLLNQADHGAGVFELDKQRLNVRESIESTVTELRPQFEEHGTSVTVAGADDLAIDADPKAIKQVITVLLSYPLRFVGPQTRTAVTIQPSGTNTVIEVSSTGLIGARADDRDKIELQLASAISLAHGARLKVVRQDPETRIVRLTFFATHAR